jgi:hypothetical protein
MFMHINQLDDEDDEDDETDIPFLEDAISEEDVRDSSDDEHMTPEESLKEAKNGAT